VAAWIALLRSAETPVFISNDDEEQDAALP
jgi:hypothetical protein